MSLNASNLKFHKIVYPSGGANVLYFNMPPFNRSPHNDKVIRHDAFSTAGKRQSVFQRADELLSLPMRFIDIIGNHLSWSEEFEQADWTKGANLAIGKNYIIQSETFDNAAWTPSSSGGGTDPTPANNTNDAPDGIVNGAGEIDFTIGPPAAETAHFTQSGIHVRLPDITSQTVTFSVWMRVASGSETIWQRLSDNTGTSEINQTITTTWTRFRVTRALDSGATAVFVQFRVKATEGAKKIFLWGAQLEYGLSTDDLADYTPTIAAAVELKIADPFWLAADSSFAGAADGLNSRLPKRARQLVFLESTLLGLSQSLNPVIEAGGLSFTGSAWSKQKGSTSTPTVNINVGNPSDEEVASKAMSVSASWVRDSISLQFLSSNVANARIKIAGQVAGTMYLFGAQLEKGFSQQMYQLKGSFRGNPIDAWKDFYDDALQGNSFDFYEDAFKASFTTYHLTQKIFRPTRIVKDFYSLTLQARKEL